ncbi:MAG: hypothetical protein KF861_07755 [Planctomycetaceae bacterium]|nr:hypothetical protein [Planctomycetaceae bacterium]
MKAQLVRDLLTIHKLQCAVVLVAACRFLAAPAASADDRGSARITEDDRAITIDTDQLQAVIPKSHPRHWMTGIEKGTFLDKKTGFREAGDGLMVIDWLMEAGSDAEYSEQVFAPDGEGVGRYTWYENETDPGRREYARMAHGSSHRKRMVEGPQLCHRMKPVQPEIIRGKDFVAVKTTYQYEYASPGRTPGSQWTQLIVFPKGERYFVLMDQIDSVNDSDEMFLRNDTPGCVRHERGDTFSEMYLSYLSGPKGLVIPSSEFFEPFPPDLKFGYRRDTHQTPEHFIRAYHLRDQETGADGPWLAGLTLEPSVVYEAWASQRPGGIIVMIEEVHGRPVKAGESFSAAHIVGYFDNIDDMHAVYEKYKGHTVLVADESGWRLE